MRLLVLLFALLFALPAAAAPGLWVVRDGDTQISIFGTVHALPHDDPGLPAPVLAQLAAADTLVLETVLPEDRMALAPLLGEIGMRPGQKPLLQRVSKPAAAKLAATVARTGLPLAALDRMATWLAALSISETALVAIGISSETGVETRLTSAARAAGKPVIGLETPEQQLRFFDNLPETDQVLMLEATLDEVEGARAEVDRLVALWQAGDVDAIARDFARDANASPLLAKVLITDRNARWADWIAGVMKRPGKVFVAVGAGHLGGPQGLLEMLKARGFGVERLETAAP
jgi:uncharacterized protein